MGSWGFRVTPAQATLGRAWHNWSWGAWHEWGRGLQAVAGWLVIAAMVAAPWFYACVPEWTQPLFGGVLFTAILIWFFGLGLRGRSPALPRLLIACVAALILLGWAGILNAQTFYDAERFVFLSANPWWKSWWAPGALDTELAQPAMVRCTLLLGVLCLCADLSRASVWRWRFFLGVLGAVTAQVVFGLTQHLAGDLFGVWTQQDLAHGVFGGFYYHGNSSAFVNLAIPGLVALSLRWKRMGFSPAGGGAAIGALALALLAQFAIVSKAGMVFALILAVVTVWWYRRTSTPSPSGAALGLAVLPSLQRLQNRWAELPILFKTDNARLLAWRACLRMLPDAGLWGIGPGNFVLAFPHYTAGMPSAGYGWWEYAHQDYLQTLIEWGWVGAALWALLFGGALFRRHFSFRDSRDRTLHSASRFALAGILVHATLDFPLQIPAIQLLVVVLLGILWHQPPRES